MNGLTTELLSQAVVEGRLTLEEFSDRVGRAQAARTREELAVLTQDLPAPAPASAPGTAAASRAASELASPQQRHRHRRQVRSRRPQALAIPRVIA